MRSLIAVITDVLNSEADIPELPPDRLIAVQDQGLPLSGKSDPVSFIKIVRLQTLMLREHEKAEIPETNSLYQIANQSGQSVLEAMATSLKIHDDAILNLVMIERLITGIVRDAYPAESERFGVRYYADIKQIVTFQHILSHD